MLSKKATRDRLGSRVAKDSAGLLPDHFTAPCFARGIPD